MQTLYQILAILGAGLLVWLMYAQVKHRPELFSKENLSKSLGTLGILALILILFVMLLVYIARMS